MCAAAERARRRTEGRTHIIQYHACARARDSSL
nr:MAG TPA: hypothetical protein [Caudoviricetes sp.]DAJ29427.1 MAG TPA: hypothetical protein [Caudoviricetes sp.]DAN87073.1 MAG TPA: hypothetical protein [Caudoviricetes sp.]DAY81701.1 MAG TPA: hypothetical protein [Caudoviricetes sp.]